MFDNETGVDILVFVSSALLCIPPAVMIFVQLKLLGRADKDGADSGKITRLYTVFDSVYFCYAFLVVAVAIVVAWSLSDSSYARRYIPPFAVSITLSIVSPRGKKSSKAFIILEKVICNFSEYSRKTGISGATICIVLEIFSPRTAHTATITPRKLKRGPAREGIHSPR